MEALREQGHDVAWVRADAPGSSDRQVLERAQRENRIIITFDKDFGELAFHAGLEAQSGVILFRISTPSATYVTQVAVAAVASRMDWAGHFAVVEDDRIRMTPLFSKGKA